MKTILILLLSVFSAAATAEVPNQFETGTPARAAEVNANFEALDNANNGLRSDVDALQSEADDIQSQIDALQTEDIDLQSQIDANETSIINIENQLSNTSAGYYLVDSTQQIVGPVLQFEDGVADTDGTVAEVKVSVVGSLGPATVIVRMDRLGLKGTLLFYESSDCTGPAYIRWNSLNFPGLSAPATVDKETGEVYVASGPVDPDIALTLTSLKDDSSCFVFGEGNTPPEDPYYPAESVLNIHTVFPGPYDVVEQ